MLVTNTARRVPPTVLPCTQLSTPISGPPICRPLGRAKSGEGWAHARRNACTVLGMVGERPPAVSLNPAYTSSARTAITCKRMQAFVLCQLVHREVVPSDMDHHCDTNRRAAAFRAGAERLLRDFPRERRAWSFCGALGVRQGGGQSRLQQSLSFSAVSAVSGAKPGEARSAAARPYSSASTLRTTASAR